MSMKAKLLRFVPELNLIMPGLPPNFFYELIPKLFRLFLDFQLSATPFEGSKPVQKSYTE